MKILNHEGRLFGKFNLFDAIILLVLLFLISMVPFWFHAPKKAEVKYVYKTVHLKASVYKDTLSLIKPGHADIDPNSGVKNAEILSIIEVKPSTARPRLYILIDGKECPIFEYDKRIVIVRMKILCYQCSNQILVQKTRNILQTDTLYTFAQQRYNLPGKIVRIEEEE